MGDLQVQQETVSIWWSLRETLFCWPLSSMNTHASTSVQTHMHTQSVFTCMAMPHSFSHSSVDVVAVSLGWQEDWAMSVSSPVLVNTCLQLTPFVISLGLELLGLERSDPSVRSCNFPPPPTNEPHFYKVGLLRSLVSYFECILESAPWSFTNSSAWSHP